VYFFLPPQPALDQLWIVLTEITKNEYRWDKPNHYEATGLPLGLIAEADYESCTAVIQPGGVVLLFTDGLPDSIGVKNPEDRLREVLADGSGSRMASLKTLVDPKLNEDV
jgi:serine phosphatase RsbU (regulator of sigma subunit)